MTRNVMAASCLLVLVACDDTGTMDRASTFTGQWLGGGEVRSIPLPVLPGSVPSPPSLLPGFTGLLEISSSEPNVIEVGPLPNLEGATLRMRVADDSSLTVEPFAEAPRPVACPAAATCPTATAATTVESATATLSGGVLTLSIQGHSSVCCSEERFIIGWMGWRP